MAEPNEVVITVDGKIFVVSSLDEAISFIYGNEFDKEEKDE